jgi:hypothetical protein
MSSLFFSGNDSWQYVTSLQMFVFGEFLDRDGGKLIAWFRPGEHKRACEGDTGHVQNGVAYPLGAFRGNRKALHRVVDGQVPDLCHERQCERVKLIALEIGFKRMHDFLLSELTENCHIYKLYTGVSVVLQ